MKIIHGYEVKKALINNFGVRKLKTIVLITGTELTRIFLHNQLQECLGEFAIIKSYAVDEGISKDDICGDFLVFSSKITYDKTNTDIIDIPYIIAKRTFNFANVDKLLYLKQGTEVLFVNDVKETTYSVIEDLNNLEINHIKFIPYYPGIDKYKCYEVAVTPGEVDMVPKGAKTIIDIGGRPIEISSLIEIIQGIGYYDERGNDISSSYVKKITGMRNVLSITNGEVITSNRDLERIVLSLNRFQIKNYKNLFQVAKNFLLIDNMNLNIKEDLYKKRYYAKYTFDHIVGKSKEITEAKNIAKKLAGTNLSVLIEGLSGTGKELFASAIHNYSPRSDEPFLAVNFSALPEELIESELFGYESGAFTGARKGGKIGLFEQASGGTIFLDKIGDASFALQMRLLRVLQEKEIMRVGGDRIIPIDVRVVAATNKNLTKLVDEGKFREDLYYRLKVGYLVIPPLRNRKEDIADIINEFFIRKDSKMKVSSEVVEIFNNAQWRGNVRELINTLEYAYEFCDGDCIKEEHLPIDFKYVEKCSYKSPKKDIDYELKTILEEIYKYQNENLIIGRRLLSEVLIDRGLNFSEQTIRTKLNSLQHLDFITKSKGKSGTKITSKGIEWLKQNG
ncbi:Ribonuclease R winged-helix domain-containing protein [Clostridium frigidicarnis]|uniref:Ribonuclease R winged-helix domain-containing protein n=1 Tax=Clostridium frigidicarnis TaxID=84698 RepID=A0A1I1AZW1_9CLOT|nr:Ribonuclease R winged-helix domain-containing protein [Clostridium frigidicarnis]